MSRIIIRQYGLAAALLILVVGLIAIYVPYVTHAQQQRAEFERYLYRAVESCQNGNAIGAYMLLSRARSYAPSAADEQFAQDLIPKFRAGDCRLTPGTSPESGEIEVP